MNKTQAILEYLKAGNKINDKIGVEKFYTYRLSGIIYNLRKLYGYNIVSEWQENKKTGARYVDYYLVSDKKEENFYKNRLSSISNNLQKYYDYDIKRTITENTDIPDKKEKKSVLQRLFGKA